MNLRPMPERINDFRKQSCSQMRPTADLKAAEVSKDVFIFFCSEKFMSEKGLAWSKSTTLESVVWLAASLLQADMTVLSAVFHCQKLSNFIFAFNPIM